MRGEIDLTERKTEERKIDEENERERERENMESDMRKRGRDRNTEIERTKQEICRERERYHERWL